MNYSYDLCGILVGIRTTYNQPRFHAVKDAEVNSSNKIQFFDLLPSWDFWGLLLCYEAINSESKTVEISFVGICSGLTIFSA